MLTNEYSVSEATPFGFEIYRNFADFAPQASTQIAGNREQSENLSLNRQ